MRRLLVSLAACALTLGVAAGPRAGAAGARPRPHTAGPALSAALAGGMRLVGPASGALVEDLSTGATLFSDNARVGRNPASVEKLYTTSTALIRYGAAARLHTAVLGVGAMQGGTYRGTLYLRGGGDPSFGSEGFITRNYGAGASVAQLVHNLIAATGIRAFAGTVVADETRFDARRGTPAEHYRPALEVEGELSALAFNRGWADALGLVYYKHPAIEAGQQFVQALKAAGVHVPGTTPIRAGGTPPGAVALAGVASPRLSTLIDLTNTPSDNFFAETLLKDIGADFGGAGTTAAGAAVVRATLAARFHLHPRLVDGSGLSRADLTSPADVVALLSQQQTNTDFLRSLAVAGRTGTLRDEMRHTYAQGRCRGKTGTLTNASNLVGYCRARDGHLLAFALLMNRIYPGYAHPIQDRMVVAMARYSG